MTQINVNAVCGGSEYRMGWVSVQSDGSVSVGLAARTFISPRFHARQDLWNVDNRVTVQYLVANTLGDLRGVINPHLTFHPPINFHLRANADELLFEGVADVGIMLAEDGRVPWIRFVTGRVHDLSQPGPARDPNTTVVRVPVVSADLSLGMGVDFVVSEKNTSSGCLVDHFVKAGQFRLQLFVEALEARLPTLAWYHQY